MIGTLLLEAAHKTSETETGERSVPRQLGFQQTIPRSFVHRAAVSEVFVTDLNILGEGRAEIGAQWPRRHSFFGPRTPSSHDPMLCAETFRQAGLLIAHQVYGIPLGHSFLSDHKTYSVDAAGLGTVGRPVDVVLQASAHDIQYRGKNVAGMRLDFECFRDGHRIGSASERWRCVSSAVYRRVRGDHFAATPFQARARPTVAPALVGRERAEDVLLAAASSETAAAATFSLQFDPDHAVLFDHPVDHVPGMVLMEAARQAALLAVGDPHALPVDVEFGFDAYVEFDAECLLLVTAEPVAADGTRRVRVVARQNGATAASGSLAMRLS
ncbi:ScbA/BarX family gamma-butyrolactone biosynthesis protein [Amycolatopsis cynarae]|uniref:ScbA/BarX family gamma-butyrolactone biosynthesis protein n=1 Tax=Amycolatopsis cynarae TaxID=2995223 RepID=A0ABY7B745_9PSEU|nr:ScbA/BarX family gamma-butyrolactone biosynthesis protein [Amycolatopsis sp. HUAS 11-8]WAL67971.1 ScbA/BarX family gamma-butyrolactone biosynthesis protein [Amycolatopsis sp. HUAS 11-8]